MGTVAKPFGVTRRRGVQGQWVRGLLSPHSMQWVLVATIGTLYLLSRTSGPIGQALRDLAAFIFP